MIGTAVCADGLSVAAFSDGTLVTGTSKLGFHLPGLGRPRTKHGRCKRVAAVRLLLGDLGLYDRAELPRVVRLAEQTIFQDYSDDDARRAFVRRHA